MIVAIFVVRTTRKIPMARDRRRVLGGTLAILAGLLVLAVPFVILATAAARWTLTPPPGTTISPAARAVLVPRAFPVHLSSRFAQAGNTPPVRDN
jgi:hypothetical protein